MAGLTRLTPSRETLRAIPVSGTLGIIAPTARFAVAFRAEEAARFSGQERWADKTNMKAAGIRDPRACFRIFLSATARRADPPRRRHPVRCSTLTRFRHFPNETEGNP
jgi:hypothetical protein